ncbi:energy-coupling factor transporter ATPase [Amphibacillus sediminis]|uniref:energy-coupling factor transporter ATPase n=1 Tax=Amphibacillus sediminis TaxID=360185 RepID=UPI0008375F9D|nr:energy-coupling factor transporter ATPase [Amphibacillus sediminis]
MQVNFRSVKADYQLGPIRARNIIDDVTFSLESGSFTAVIGRTGAGKSSLLKLMNGLLLPAKGEVSIGELELSQQANKKVINQIRKRVGMVFQFPEHQLFAETVGKDIAFGPRNFGLNEQETKKAVQESIRLVGLDPDILERSPFSLSGGQQRRVAIAGILATNPDVLILDEPGAGLDPEGKQKILTMIKTLHVQKRLTTVLVTHDMNDVATYADDVLLIDQGKLVCHQPVRTFFQDNHLTSAWHIDLPEPLRLQRKIERAKNMTFKQTCLTLDELSQMLIREGLV